MAQSSTHVDVKTGGGNDADLTATIHQAPPAPPQQAQQSSAEMLAPNGPILARLKELEAINQNLVKNVEEAKAEAQAKDDKIKVLSAEKRKDMEQMIETAIDTWLNSLTGLPDEVRKQFRTGISRIAEHADMKNAAWEVVCQASALHRANVNRIEELITTCNQQTETIKSLVGSSGGASDPTFASDASRVTGAPTTNKRPRVAESPSTEILVQASAAGGASTTAAAAGGGDAWDLFASMLKDHARTVYF